MTDGVNKVLLAGGFSLITMSLVALVLDRGAPIEGGLALLGTVLLVVSVVAPRLTGKQEFGLTKVTLNLTVQKQLKMAAKLADQEVASRKHLPRLEDLDKGRS